MAPLLIAHNDFESNNDVIELKGGDFEAVITRNYFEHIRGEFSIKLSGYHAANATVANN